MYLVSLIQCQFAGDDYKSNNLNKLSPFKHAIRQVNDSSVTESVVLMLE